MGYSTEIPEYHAWNEIYVGGSWFKVDATYDAQVAAAGLTVTMQKIYV
jgi:transglutaminase-like putative cysteine protease